MRLRRFAWFFFACISLPFLAEAQAPAQPAPEVHGITVSVVVNGNNGKPVSGLEKKDFTLLDNKQPDEITSVEEVDSTTAAAVNPPTQAIFVIDTVNPTFETLSREHQQLEKFFAQNGGHLPLPVSLVIFSNSGLSMQHDASRDGKTELEVLNKNPVAIHGDNRAQGEPGAFDRIERSLTALRTIAVDNLNVPGNKLLVWISPGWPVPMESALGLSPKEKEQVFNRIVATSGLLMLSHITLYSVDPLGTDDAGTFTSSRYQNYLGEIKDPTQPQVANLALQVFAIHSGGRAFSGSNDVAGELTSCIEDGNTFYRVTFDPPRADHPNEYHHLEVKLDKPELKARTRAGYYIQP